MLYPRLPNEHLSDEERQSLILEHLPQVRLLARRIYGRLPEHVSFDDLVSAGIVGLIAAIDRFDPSRQVPLRTFAAFKIKGEILDSLRRLDWAPRQQRKQAKQIQAAIAVVQQRWQRIPTDEEIAGELSLGIEVYRRRQAKLGGLKFTRLDSVESDSGACDRRSVSRDARHCPSAVFEHSELQRTLAAAISRLPQTHQTVLRMYYGDGLSLPKIARIIGRHGSRISKIRRQAILQLRSCMTKLWPIGGQHGFKRQRDPAITR